MHFTNFLYNYQRDKTYQLSVVVGSASAINALREMHTLTFELQDVATRRKMLTFLE